MALEEWPRSGLPENPGAWLMATAKRRAIDRLRRSAMSERKHEALARERGDSVADDVASVDAALDFSAGLGHATGVGDEASDDLLRLVFTCCHPALSSEAQVALTLRLLGGLTTDEIARAYLVPEATVAQRIVRAKRTLANERVAFEVPTGAELAPRLASVLRVIYLIFNEGHTATAGEELTRPALCDDALRLARILAGLAPDEPEVHGLLALLELQASRLRARVDATGAPVLLLDQDRARWDRLLVQRGLAALARAEALGAARLGPDDPPIAARGPYTLQAAISACHARALTPEATEWPRIAALYAALAQVAPSPVVELNRAVALGFALGPALGPSVGLELVDALVDEPALADYHLLPAVRGDLLAKLGRHAEAKLELARAASLAKNAREKALLHARAEAEGLPRPARAARIDTDGDAT